MCDLLITLRAVYCNLSCLLVCLFVGVCVCGSVTTITRNCVHRSSPNRICRWSSDHLQLIKFWPSCAPGKGSAVGRNILALPCYSQRAVFASLRALFYFFSEARAEIRPLDRFWRIMAQNARNHARMCLFGDIIFNFNIWLLFTPKCQILAPK